MGGVAQLAKPFVLRAVTTMFLLCSGCVSLDSHSSSRESNPSPKEVGMARGFEIDFVQLRSFWVPIVYVETESWANIQLGYFDVTNTGEVRRYRARLSWAGGLQVDLDLPYGPRLTREEARHFVEAASVITVASGANPNEFRVARHGVAVVPFSDVVLANTFPPPVAQCKSSEVLPIDVPAMPYQTEFELLSKPARPKEDVGYKVSCQDVGKQYKLLYHFGGDILSSQDKWAVFVRLERVGGN